MSANLSSFELLKLRQARYDLIQDSAGPVTL